jgi:2-polyprenyl-3-methyl-5-hydroxy-6-metoxy-1,4-benzoquinol methylase
MLLKGGLRRLWKSMTGVAEPRPAVSEEHRIAAEYWRSCTNTFVTNAAYYDRVEATLRTEILPRIGNPRRVLDIGCGNGRFTFVLAEAAAHIDAFDLSPALIEEGRAASKAKGIRNVRFRVGDASLPEWGFRRRYDVVACMGVLSTIIDESVFNDISASLAENVRSGGLIVLRDSLSNLPEGQLVVQPGYATRYRYERGYRERFSALGMVLEHEVLLAEFGTCVNRCFLFRSGNGRMD